MSVDVPLLLTIYLLVAAVARVLWFVEFLLLSALRRGNDGLIRHWQADMRLPLAIAGNRERQAGRYDLFYKLQVAAYTVGVLALAAWTIIVGTHSDKGTYGRFTLAMLGVAIVVSLGSTVLFRIAGGEFSRMGYESCLAMASLALVFGTATLVLGPFYSNGLSWLIVVLGALVVVRDVADTLGQMKTTQNALSGSNVTVGPGDDETEAEPAVIDELGRLLIDIVKALPQEERDRLARETQGRT